MGDRTLEALLSLDCGFESRHLYEKRPDGAIYPGFSFAPNVWS
jgi:hypothetical protein